LKNLGNFSNRCLKFLDSSFGGIVPAYEGPKVDYDAAFYKSIYEKFLEFIDLMEEVKLKDSLRVTMAMSSLCNGYMQETQPWVLAKSDPKRCQQVMNTCIQSINLLAGMLEPFMPSFSAKVYEQMNIKRTLLHETLYEFLKKDSKNIEILVPTGHKIGEPQPIFREISNEEMENWKKQFA
jgi:methionyl-tRNA synthetase